MTHSSDLQKKIEQAFARIGPPVSVGPLEGGFNSCARRICAVRERIWRAQGNPETRAFDQRVKKLLSELADVIEAEFEPVGRAERKGTEARHLA